MEKWHKWECENKGPEHFCGWKPILDRLLLCKIHGIRTQTNEGNWKKPLPSLPSSSHSVKCFYQRFMLLGIDISTVCNYDCKETQMRRTSGIQVLQVHKQGDLLIQDWRLTEELKCWYGGTYHHCAHCHLPRFHPTTGSPSPSRSDLSLIDVSLILKWIGWCLWNLQAWWRIWSFHC